MLHLRRLAISKGPKYLHGTKYGFCSSNFPYGFGKDSPYEYLGPFGYIILPKGFWAKGLGSNELVLGDWKIVIIVQDLGKYMIIRHVDP